MATKTLSASLDPAIYRATQRVAKEERRPQSAALAAEAVTWARKRRRD